jgi:menaquinone-dependent protoporphyrinogen oxidase
MHRILVVYGTTHGQTAKIARAIGETLSARHFDVDVAEAPTAFRPDAYAGIVVAASVHAGRYQQGLRRWVRPTRPH